MAVSEILGLVGVGGGILSNAINNQAISDLNWQNIQNERYMLGLQAG